jgi:hypothetical protein
MEDKISLEILCILERSKSLARETVKSEILSMTSFAAIGQEDFVSAWEKLLANGCIQEFRNDQKKNSKEYRLNPTKDCLTFYSSKKIENDQSLSNKSEIEKLQLEINKLTLERLNYETTIRDLQKSLSEAQLKDIPKNAQHRDDTLFWQIIAGAAATIAFLLKLFGVEGWL